MDKKLELVWEDLVKKARIKEDHVVIKELEKNSVGAINIFVVESTGKGAIVITQAYSMENSNEAIDINKIHLPKYKLKEIVSLL